VIQPMEELKSWWRQGKWDLFLTLAQTPRLPVPWCQVPQTSRLQSPPFLQRLEPLTSVTDGFQVLEAPNGVPLVHGAWLA